jgi:hypothetical protein
MKVTFDIPDDCYIVEGLFISEYIDQDGVKGLQTAIYGQPTYWARIGLLEAALARTQERLRARWEEKE